MIAYYLGLCDLLLAFPLSHAATHGIGGSLSIYFRPISSILFIPNLIASLELQFFRMVDASKDNVGKLDLDPQVLKFHIDMMP